jgi:hypothetical protein
MQGTASPTGTPVGASSYADGTEYSSVERNWEPGNTGYNPPSSATYPASTQPAAAPAGTGRRDPSWRPGSTTDYLPTRGAQTSQGSDNGGYGVTPAAYSAPSQTAPRAAGSFPTATNIPTYGGSSSAIPASYPTTAGGSANPGSSGLGSTPGYGVGSYGMPTSSTPGGSTPPATLP